MKDLFVRLAVNHPKWVVAVSLLATVALTLQIPRIQIDTDPENMLPADESVRVFHDEVKEAFGLHDLLVVGVVREEGVFRPQTLERVHRITQAILEMDGVIEYDVFAPSEVDDIYTIEGGDVLRVDTLMEEPPDSTEESERILARIADNPILRGKLASDDGRAIAIFVPLESKDVAHEVARRIEEVIAELGGDEEYHLAGVPLAEDTFGAQMFLQMGLYAPAAFLVIFLVMLFFFRKPLLVVAPMIVAMMTVLWTMGLLIGLGFTVHIMSSMIPVFLIPIAVLDSIHILTEFHEHYPKTRDMKKTIRRTMDELYVPMAFTTLTTMAGFASLLLTPIPPVQVFGAFVALGIGVAWLLTMTFSLAYAMLLPEKALANFGAAGAHDLVGDKPMRLLRDFSLRFRKPLVAVGAIVFALSLVGLSRIQVNDNPVHWFKPDHPLRVADVVMNEHLDGTYMAYLALESAEPDGIKSPDVMRYIEGLQRRLETDPNVGRTTSVVDVVKKVRAELKGDPSAGVVPDSQDEVAQSLFLYEMSGGDADDLFKLITPESDRASIWIQMREGENRDVARVVALADQHLREYPPPGLDVAWAGLPYINIVWQQKMVAGMGKALTGSFVIVLVMMTILFRSLRLGLLSMIPLTATITVVYGAIGAFGKDYDMPIAVLSSLTLGLSIDFAIHFLQRTREAYERRGTIEGAMEEVFQAPARAIVRNVFVIAIGFVPMFFASLVPYITVSIFFFAIMLVSGFTTLFSLTSILASVNPDFLRKGGRAMRTKKTATAGKAATALILASVLAAPATRAEGEAPDAAEIMKNAHLAMYYAGEDGRAVVEMEMVDKKGRTRSRKFVMTRIDESEGGDQKYFTYFFEPNDVRRTTFMVWKDAEKDDSRWIYVPAVDLIKRISANDKGSSFVGSDFSYEDVSGRHWTDDTHEYVRAEELDGRAAHVIESVPKGKDSFAKKITWVGVEETLPLKEEYYDAKGRLTRVFRAEEIDTVDGHPTVIRRSMTNERKDHHTVVIFSDVRYDVGVDAKIFSERYLKAPPTLLTSEGS